MRILPEIWANTLWPLSNSTRNIALGNVSSTVPVTSMASSLGIENSACSASPRNLQLTQNIRAALGDRHRVLEVGGQATIFRHRGPTVFLNFNFITAGGDHRLRRPHTSFFLTKASVRVAPLR